MIFVVVLNFLGLLNFILDEIHNFFFFFLWPSKVPIILLRGTKKGFRKLVIVFFPVKNTPKLINQQLKNVVKIVNWKKKVSYCFFYCKKYPYLKLKNRVKIVN